ncbi:MAG: type II secretion system protein M [Gammaproteobacteria bacterium]|nr:type II secretion system protein M [Gammaproteobacteria bacterium]
METLAARWRQSSIGQRFYGLESRQQRIASAIAALAALAALYVLVWQPVSDWSSRAQNRYARELAVLDYLRANEAAARSASQATAVGGGSILTTVADTAAAAGISLTRYQNEAGGGLSIVLQDQEFDAVLAWLAELEGKKRRIRQLSVDAQGNPGRVNARISVI